METRIDYINGEKCAVGVSVISDNEARELRDYAVANQIPLQVAFKRVGTKFVRCAMDENGKIVTLERGQVYRLFDKQDDVEKEVDELEEDLEDDEDIDEDLDDEPEEEPEEEQEPQEAPDGIYSKALESRVEDLCDKLDTEKGKVELLTKENLKLLGALSTADGTIAELNAHITELTEELEQSKDENDKLVDQISQLLIIESTEEEEVDEPKEPEEEITDEREITIDEALAVLRAHGIKSIVLD